MSFKFPPRKFTLFDLVRKLSEQGWLHIEATWNYDLWVLALAPELLKQFQRLEVGETVEEVLGDALPYENAG
jgi:hypothetical protein